MTSPRPPVAKLLVRGAQSAHRRQQEGSCAVVRARGFALPRAGHVEHQPTTAAGSRAAYPSRLATHPRRSAGGPHTTGLQVALGGAPFIDGQRLEPEDPGRQVADKARSRVAIVETA